MRTATRRGVLALVIVCALVVLGVVVALTLGALVLTLSVPDIVVTPGELADASADRDPVIVWLARGLLALAVAWVVIGFLASGTRLVRRPGAAAARAAWLGSTRPWRARESTLGMLPLDRWLMLVVPAALLVATHVVETAFVIWTELVIVLGAWLVFAIVVRAFVGSRSPWAVLAAVGGAIVLQCIVVLIPLSFSGASAVWSAVWADPLFRAVYITVAFAVFAWVFVVAAWSLVAQFGPRRAIGFVFTGMGAAGAVLAIGAGAVGHGWAVPWVAAASALLLLAGLLLALLRSRQAS